MSQPLWSNEEKAQLFKALADQATILGQQSATLNEQSATLADLKRGMYGDDKNKQKGLVQEVYEIKTWIEKSKVKVTIISTVAATLGFLLNKGWEWLIHSK